MSAGSEAGDSSTWNREGYMVKEGGSIKTWKKRWFELKDGTLSYYKSKEDTEPIDKIQLSQTTAIRNCDQKKKQPNAFEVVTPKRTYAFSTESEAERKWWLDALVGMQTLNLNDSSATKPTTEAVSPAKSSSGAPMTVNDFDLLTLVGKGSFGKVIQVRKKDDGKIYAMKVLDKKHILDHNEVTHTLAEKNILQKVQHPFLVNLNFSFQTEDKLYFILDFVNGGELFYHLQREKRFSEERARYYSAEILLALSCLHENGVVYRDLKPENILLTNEGHICLTDFGLSKEGLTQDTDKTTTFCGTPEYLAPEVLRGKGYGRAVDWWSFGSLLYEMLCGLPPFYSQDVQEMYRKIMTDTLRFPSHVNGEARDLLDQLLQRDQHERLTDPAKIKAHPFYAHINWDDLYHKKTKPPFVPKVKGASDVSQIDPVFVKEAPFIAPSTPNDINAQEQRNFEGFTYIADADAPN